MATGSTPPREHRRLRDADIEDALSSRAHRLILAACIQKAVSVKEVCALTGLPLASAYRNVSTLLEQGLLIVERSAMTSEGKPYDLYRARIEEATLRLSADGIEVGWRVNRSVEDRLLHLWSYLGA